ncbi:MAG: glycosyltransferase [Chthoniobacterales bacterium]|nr:glycosyltransferase [Chthoniobacterales bacterium]
MKGGYSVVIATCDRDEPLARVLEDWSAQTAPPEKVVVTGADAPGRNASAGGGDEANVTRLVSPVRSAARQRNLGAEVVETEWIVFCDDDVRFAPDLAAVVLEFLAAHPEAVAVSPRMRGASHPRPGRWLRRYYGLQAGFPDGTYGGRLFGAGITCYPCWDIQPAPVEANWLPSTMLWMKAAAFRRHRFPDFEGYSFGEDAHLTHRVWRDAEPAGRKLYFLGAPEFDHLSIQSGVKADRFRLGRMVVRNQKRIAREAMGKGAWEVFWKSFVHRMFVTAALIKGRRSGWVGEMIGLWSA